MQRNNNISISIIIPTYNRAATIGKTIDSFIAQDYKDWEMIVVDDHSTDNTKEVIDNYHRKDGRIRYLLNERKKGAQGARNTGLKYANYDWVIFFDSDNVAHSNMLSELVWAVRDDIDVVSCFSNVIDIKTHKQIRTFEWVNEGDIHKRLFSWDSYVDFNQAIIRKKKLYEIGMLDEDCPSMQEWETHIRLSMVATYTTIHKHLLDYYVGAKDSISSNKQREVIGRMYVLNKHKREWASNKEALIWILNNIYTFIRKNDGCWFRLKYMFRLMCISPRIFPIVVEYRKDYIKRKLNIN